MLCHRGPVVLAETTDDAAPGAQKAPQRRRIWLCADDYGMSPGVNSAIRDLIALADSGTVSPA